MKGLQIAKKFYQEYGAPMLHQDFSEIENLIAVGLVGSGSECFGYDDEFSKDHDFEAGFCLFLPPEEVIDRQTAFKLERAYAKLPKEYMGVKRNTDSSFDTGRHGVIRIDEFYSSKVGTADGALTYREWLSLPDYYLAEATNGEVFRDDVGYFSDIRKALSAYPNDIRLKKLAGALARASQCGDYNYNRCMARGETATAQIALFKYVKNIIQCAFLLSNKYMPYYKWAFRALRDLEKFACLSAPLERLITTPNGKQEIELKRADMYFINSEIAQEIRAQGLSDFDGEDLSRFAYCINDKIRDIDIRNIHILASVED